MRRELAALLTGCMFLLAACAGLAASDPVSLMDQPEGRPVEEVYEQPEYTAAPFTSGNQIRSEDQEQKVLALYNYQIVLLGLDNPDKVSPKDGETAERNIEVFNSRMRSVLAELVEQGKAMADDAADAYGAYGAQTEEYEDDADMSADFCGDVVSICLNRSSYTGGAHPNRYAVGYLFDLKAGQFIDPTQIAGDPEVFRTGAAELLLEKAEAHEARESFWQDYADIIGHWSEGTVLFDQEGMRVIYSPYELGPYAMGDVEFRLSWEELEPLVGPEGMMRLGRTEEK